METLEFPTIADTPLHVEQPTGELVIIKTGVAELDPTAAHLAALQHRLKGIAYPALNTGAGMQAALDDRRTLIDLRVGLGKLVEQANKKDRADTKARCDKREAGAETLTREIKALELPIDEQIKAEEHRKAEAKRIKDEAEAARKAQHVAGIAKIAGYVAQAAGKSSDKLAAGIAFVETIHTHPDAFEEFSEEATQTKARTLLSLRHLHAAALRDEEDARQREEQRVENARVAAALAEQARELAELRADIERKRAELEAARKVAEAQAARVVQVAAPAGYIEPQTVLTTTAKPITQDAQERGSLPAAAGACASAEAKAATAAVSGCEGKGAHAEERAPEPVFNIVSLERGAAAIDAASSGSPELGAVLESIATMELYKITMIEPIRGIDPRDALLREALALTKYAAAPFFSKFPTHPKTTPEWWAGLREQIEALQPKLIDHIQGLN